MQANRYKIYHFLQEKRGRKQSIYTIIERGMMCIQKIFKVDRTKKYKNIRFRCGSNWASITHDLALHMLSREEEIKKMFSYSFCCDEFFMQTIAYNSSFRNAIFKSEEEHISGNLRFIDWQRGDLMLGSPYTFKIDDYDMLMEAPELFCRKITDSTPEGNALIEKLEQL